MTEQTNNAMKLHASDLPSAALTKDEAHVDLAAPKRRSLDPWRRRDADRATILLASRFEDREASCHASISRV